MEWFCSLLKDAAVASDHAGFGVAAVLLVCALGCQSAVVSASCTLPVLSVIAGGCRLNSGEWKRSVHGLARHASGGRLLYPGETLSVQKDRIQESD